MRIGVDLGTTRTVVAGIDSGNYPVFSFEHASRMRDFIPTLVAARDGELLFGWQAAKESLRGEASLFRGLKRMTATEPPDSPVDVGEGVTASIIELLTGYLIHLREELEKQADLSDSEELEAMIATPANANSNQRFLTLEAFRRAGFTVLEVLNEPSVAALEHVHRFLQTLGQRSPKEHVVVYDLGGGTFDTAAVKFSDKSFNVLCHEGISRLGGEDFDRILLEMALSKAGVDEKSLSSAARSRLLEECRERKEGLTPNTRRVAVDLTVQGVDETVVVDAGEYYDACLPVLEPSIAAVTRVLEGLCGSTAPSNESRRLASVYLVGGSCSFPPVARRLRETFGRKVKHAPTPFAATAVGLAIAADPQADVRMRESVSRYFGVWREAADGRDKCFDILIPKDAALRTGKTRVVVRSYRPSHNIGHLRFMECGRMDPDGKPSGDLHPWPEVLFPYDPQLVQAGKIDPSRVVRRPDLEDQEIFETYRYESGGILTVKIENRTAGYLRTYSLAPGVGFSDDF